jgi:hypothetical protein
MLCDEWGTGGSCAAVCEWEQKSFVVVDQEGKDENVVHGNGLVQSQKSQGWPWMVMYT